MIYPNAAINNFHLSQIPLRHFISAAITVLLLQFVIFAQTNGISTTDDNKTLIVDDANQSEILAFGKNVIVRQHAKGVFAFGGDILIEGKIDEDVAVIGGSVIQKTNAEIGGDVIVLGGSYKPETEKPLRAAGKETIIIGVFEEELRNFAQDPTGAFSPTLSWRFFGQRILSVFFWFLISFAFTTISPGAVSRAVARIQLSSLKIIGIGISGLLLTTITVMFSVAFLPGYLSGIIGLAAIFLLFTAYLFGRVALQVSFGKILQKHLFSEKKHSETLAILLGVIVWTMILSVPYLWTFALVILFSASIGLVATAKAKNGWQTN